jgi:hypothetical protein
MRRYTTWPAYVDMLMCVLVVIITMVATRKVDNSAGVKLKAEYIITAEWSVDVDADADLWVVPPPGDKPVFYSSREAGCLHLDRDSRGFMDNIVHLPDGRTIKSLTAKETTTMRCIVAGRYDIGVHLYDYRTDGTSAPSSADKLGLKVLVQVVKVNPQNETVFTDEITLDRPWQTVNVASFDLDGEGRATFVDPPLEPITAKYYNNRVAK